MTTFTIYPAIDLRRGQVVRLRQGDPGQQTIYSTAPALVAARWLEAGARWLHVVNLDGALGEADLENQAALKTILEAAGQYAAKVQFGGGLRSLERIENALRLGIQRIILGTAAFERPDILNQAVQRFGGERIAVALDARQGAIRTRGWTAESGKQVLSAGEELASLGLRTVIYTDIRRDGMGVGVDISLAQALARLGLEVIASGGVHSLEDIRGVRQAGLSGVVIGRALYEGNFRFEEALAC